MLATKIKIQTILKQRQFIEEQLSLCHIGGDGDPSYIYAGHIYLENIEYFNKLGFNVQKLDSENIRLATHGRVMYVFFPAEFISLTPEEMKEAEEYLKPKEMSDKEIEEKLAQNAEIFSRAIIGPEDYE